MPRDANTTAFNVILFDGFESLDVFGPVEVIGQVSDIYRLGFYSLHGGIVTSAQDARVDTYPMTDADPDGVLLVPGGPGTRLLIDDATFINQLLGLAKQASFVLTVCTGAALLARTGLLDDHRATTNKLAFDWVASTRPQVDWIRQARWVRDDIIYTSSGVSAGIDMVLGFIASQYGTATAQQAAYHMEYVWNTNPYQDPFALT